MPPCAPTVHAERFIICELTMSPGAGWSGRRRRNRAALGTRSRGRLTGERASSTIAPLPPTATQPGTPPSFAAVPQFGGGSGSTAGTGWCRDGRWWCRRCTVGLRGSLFRQLAPLSHEQLQPPPARSDGQGCSGALHRWRQLRPNQPQLCPTLSNNFQLENRFNA